MSSYVSDARHTIMQLARLLEAALQQLPDGKVRVEVSENDLSLRSSSVVLFKINKAQHPTDPWKIVMEAYIPGMEKNRPKRKFELEGS